MDFLKILKSLEEALYEVMVWLAFYPITFWQVIRRPALMMNYADTELDDADEDRYSDRLSPPIFLAITLGLAHALEIALGQNAQTGDFLADDRNLLAYRMIAFSVFPLILAIRLLRRRRVMLDRKLLRAPFYSQCYVAGPFAAAVSSAPIIGPQLPVGQVNQVLIVIAIILIATIWYLALQTRWFARELETSPIRGFGHAVASFFEALVIVIILSSAISLA